MEIILSQDVGKIGKVGAKVKVKDGFARNFLIPKGMAIEVSPANLKMVEQEKQNKLTQQAKAKKGAEEIKARLSKVSITLPVLTHEQDKLYASISASEIVNALKEEGFEIDKSCVVLDEPIRALGIYEVPVKLHAEVVAAVKIWVVKK